MYSGIINTIIAGVGFVLAAVNLFTLLKGAARLGKIARYLGQYGYHALLLFAVALIFVDTANSFGHLSHWHTRALSRTGITLEIIIMLDNFINGGDPPQRRRREWLKNKFAKLAPVRA